MVAHSTVTPMRAPCAQPFARRQAGFTYVGMVVLVTILGLVGAATVKATVLLQRAAAEYELLAIGAEFSAALASYAQATPPGQARQPASLEALLRDPRFPVVRRHLRRIFVDPITGRAEWGLVRATEGGPILGVYSLSPAQPLKVANFDARFVNFDNKQHFSDWKFLASAQAAQPRAREAAPPAAAPAILLPATPLAPAPGLAPAPAAAEPATPDPAPMDEPAAPEPDEEEEPPAAPPASPVR